MRVQSLDAMAMVDDDLAAISRAHAGLENRSIRRRAYRIADRRGNINAAVEGAFVVKRIEPSAERTGDHTLNRPKRWRIRSIRVARAHNAAQCGWEVIRYIYP